MSTNDVPGANPANHDELSMGCWGEHEDGSLVLVENTEGNRVIFSVFDVDKDPVVEYRDAMPEVNFKKQFTWNPSDPKSVKWTWHDKTQFPWDSIIKKGAQDGMRYASADGLKSAAQRVAESLTLLAREYDGRHGHMTDEETSRIAPVLSRIEKALNDLPRQIGEAIRDNM
jgi:hypothetical protein